MIDTTILTIEIAKFSLNVLRAVVVKTIIVVVICRPSSVVAWLRSSCLFFVYRTILLSVISLLSEPNTINPANVDAALMYCRWKDSSAEDQEYESIIAKQVCKLFSFFLTLKSQFFFLPRLLKLLVLPL